VTSTERCHLLQGAGFFEQVGRAGDDLDGLHAVHAAERLAIECHHLGIAAADDQQGRRFHPLQCIAGQIRAPAARDHRGHPLGFAGGGDQRGGRAGAGAEQTQRQVAHVVAAVEPLDRSAQAAGQQIDVEHTAQVGRFRFGQQVEQQRGDAGAGEHLGHRVVAGTAPAAAAAVRKDHHASHRLRHAQQAVQAPMGNLHRMRRDEFIRVHGSAHGVTSLPDPRDERARRRYTPC
jgi:hypothetical protein